MNNRELSGIFHRMAACYRYLGPRQRFRAIAYENASRTIASLKEDVSSYGNDVKALDALHGIGESIAEKIVEYVNTGDIRQYRELQKKVPEGLLELMDITGFGPATVKRLHRSLDINNRDDLVKAIDAGRLQHLKGFGKRKIDNLQRGLKLYKQGQERMLLSTALEYGNRILEVVRNTPGILQAGLAGSLRRMKETIGDLDVVACAGPKDLKRVGAAILSAKEVGRVLAKGDTKLSFLLKEIALQVDVRIVDPAAYGAALLYFTGSMEHNVALRLHAKNKGCKLSEYGLFDTASDKLLAGKTEAEIYKWLGLQFVPPELRENKGELEKARARKLPSLADVSDLRGDMQMHSRWSDGAESIEAIAKYILKQFPGYEYIVITDHSPSQRVAGGLQPEEFEQQFREIDRVNKIIGRQLIRKGVEVDILANGELDLPDELLEQFEWVTASVHSGFNKDNTARLVKACRHPLVNCIGHPSGRLIGKREPYPVDWARLFRVAAETGTAVEINAQPDRLDLRDDLVRDAVDKGVMLTISTDAHSLSQFHWMQFGVAVARRGWCTGADILNTRSWNAVEKFRDKKRAAILHQLG